MTITAKVIADSVAEGTGIRLLTFELRYPRFIHSEFMTHRVFSRNASSSRAIPVKRLLAAVRQDMAEPVSWGKNQPGMQAREDLTGWRLTAARLLWRSAGHTACAFASLAAALGAHKQIVNRLIEPWSHITVVVTGTEWSNFFALRDHKDADPTIAELAFQMRIAMLKSIPKVLKPGQWHLPYCSVEEKEIGESGVYDWVMPGTTKQDVKRASAARCARTSYLTHDGETPDIAKDLGLFQRLAGAAPQHLSPTEHQATPSGDENFHANFRGWVQFRKEVDHAA